MSTDPKDGKLLYHLTSLENVKSILQTGLKSRKTLLAQINNFDDTADKDILQGRKNSGLDEYVPFHFFTKTPYCGRVLKDNANTEFVYITIKRSWLENKPNAYIIPSHPLSSFRPEILSYNEGFSKIDWELVRKRDYSDVECKEACMCEALYKGDIDVEYIFLIAVKTQSAYDIIEKIIYENGLKIKVNLCESWFAY